MWEETSAPVRVSHEPRDFRNALAAGDEELSSDFARTGEDRYAKHPQRFGSGLAGIPVLQGAVASSECHSRQR